MWLCPDGIVIGPQEQLLGSATCGAAEEDLGQGSQSLRHCSTPAAPTVLPSLLAVAVESNNALEHFSLAANTLCYANYLLFKKDHPVTLS